MTRNYENHWKNYIFFMGIFSCANLNNVKQRNNRLLLKSDAQKKPIKTDHFPMNLIIPNLFPNMLILRYCAIRGHPFFISRHENKQRFLCYLSL